MGAVGAGGPSDVTLISSLLVADDVPPVSVFNADGNSAFLIVADHAGNAFPRALGKLGIDAPDQERHIAWDIGIGGVCRTLADLLHATFIRQNYSRLVIDCNRPQGAPDSIPPASDGTSVPGNAGLSPAERAARKAAIFDPYHACIATELDRRQAASRPTVLIAMHSFTPVFRGVERPWHVGMLYHRDARFARALLARLRQDPGLVVGDNEPYAVSDATDWTIPHHGERRDILHVGIEIRQDLIAQPQGQLEWAERMATALPHALAACAEEQRADAPGP
ncbi:MULTISPECIES: N-formylglutamate amidohydrolase [unclassified Xanthobacter]|uniref:N-formylglutamate amidohydrolase n=1 Tax=unclassified Xanthobacter TaxID=2623496 RepID=UPI001F1F26A9|nr:MULTISPECIES: N-formylglutamate amidohydrolase [unclassified Xanthobacter]